MKRVIGFALFCIAFGMILVLILPYVALEIFLILLFLFLGISSVLLLENDLSYNPHLSIKKIRNHKISDFFMSVSDYARSTRPDFRQEVHTYIFLDPPSVLTRTDFTLDFHIFGDFL